MNKRRWGCLAVVGLLAIGVLLVLGGLFRPEPPTPDLRLRTHPARPAPSRSFTVGGQVLGADENGVADVVVEVYATDHSRRWEATTDANGRFALRGVTGVVEVRPTVPTAPASTTLIRPRTDLVFRLATRCSLTVDVDAGDAPITGGVVNLYAASGELLELTLDAQGRGSWAEVPCGPATLEARADGFLPNTEAVETSDGHAHLWLQPDHLGLVRIHGLVTSEGHPVAGAELAALPLAKLPSGLSGPDGAYTVFVEGPGPYALIADHHAYQYELDSLLVPPGVDAWEHDVELAPIRKVKVHCAGLPDDGCHDLPLVMCSEAWAPGGFPCVEEAGDITCRCPMGEAAVRGGGESVLVAHDADTAWLDFRVPGGLSGRVLVDGTPTPCTLEVVRWSLDLGGAGGLRTDACAEDGSFVVPSLKPGDWRLVVRSQGLEQAVGPVSVADAVVDLGSIDLMAGMMLSGRVVWEDDGGPAAGEPVAAVEVDSLSGGMAPPVGTATTDDDGGFAILGLQPGRYQVMVPHDPGGAQVVELDEEDVYVELVRAGGSGLQLTLDEDDRIVVAEADDEGWLEPGDRLETVTVAGIDVLELAPRYGQEVGELVVGLVGYPGITVVVERDGQPVVVGGE